MLGKVRNHENTTPTLTRSEKKLYDIYKLSEDPESETDQSSSEDDDDSDTVFEVEENLVGHRIIDVEIPKQNISSLLCCGFCHSTVHLIEAGRMDFSSELAFHCTKERCNCKGGHSFSTCQKIHLDVGSLKVNTINRRAALAMRSIGRDHEDLHTFCGIMSLPPPAGEFPMIMHVLKTMIAPLALWRKIL